MDEIWKIVEQAIVVGGAVEQHDATRKRDALRTLQRLADELRAGASDHPALKKLKEYIEEYDR